MKQFYYLFLCRSPLVRFRQNAYRIAILLCIGVSLTGFSDPKHQAPNTIELHLKNVTLREALREIERQTNYNFVVNHNRLQILNKTVSLNISDNKIENILNILLEGSNVTYTIRKRQITLIPPSSPTTFVPMTNSGGVTSVDLNTDTYTSAKFFFTAITVSGKITEEDGTPLPGVNVLEKGTTVGTVTDSEGAYTLNVTSGESVLVFSFIGYLTEEVVVGNQATINIQLKSDAKTLSEVVVVGYGTQDKKDVTGAISSVKGSDFQNLPVSSTQQALQGRASGVTVIRSGGEPGNSGSIRIRGVGTVNNADPLIIIDGVPSDGPLADVNPNDIESIEVLKDASASAIYGTRAANGVVIVTTKRGKFGQALKMSVNGY
ncbi:MAG: hypothetical protein C0490_13060, partial [Marivirga sp.]|nr:hypothetical protein [Marivirga sp.]